MSVGPDRADPVRVLIVDDDLFVRTALGGYVSDSPGLHLVGLCENGADALAALAVKRVDVVVMDIQMPVMDGVTAAGRMRDEHPDVRVLMLTSFDEDNSIRAAISNGAGGYLLKSATPEALISAIHAVYRGAGVMTPETLRRVAGPARPTPPAEVVLSSSEHDVLRLLCKGFSNAEIAAALYLSESTVKVRLGSLGDKLGTTSRVTTAIRGWELGLAGD
ncbi:response regulator transcription factor [Micropruina sonneratiae]|uniref:response regulator transcription factor n=1 Tax=Micropruina sonneratiae TaxID=2986940 RepID=UPI0022262836|nr:response regulator transcription factor [Micropruina sp. KQZ13P-5]MCW3156932.1 response regulator transcription factor [Micropruina sp. KQZ13P-5]